MSIILVLIVSLSGVITGRLLFKKWFNHFTLYCFIMGGLIFLYELKLLPYPDLIPEAWFYLISSFLCFLFGIITIVTAKNLYSTNLFFSEKQNIELPIFADGGRVLKYSVIFFSVIALFVAIQRWYVLINMFGSISSVLVNAAVIYRLNVQQEIKEFIPILPSFVYVAIFLAGIYTAYKRKFTFLSFLPFIGIILKELTYFGRAELLLTMMEFLFSFFLFRHLLNTDKEQKFKFSKNNALFASVVLIILLLTAASFVRVSRGSFENYRGASKELKQLKDNFIISPSIYLYLSSDVGVFSKYLEAGGEDTGFGENTFYIVHVFLSRLGLIEEPTFFQKGYHIPLWTNTGTYIRELHADFGVTGVFLFPYFFGLITSWLWFKFFNEKSIIVFAFLVYFYLIIGFSFLVMVTKLNQWYFSLTILVFLLPILERIAVKRFFRRNI